MNEKLKYLTLFVIGMMLSLGMNAQSVKSISGTVTDDQGEAVISGTVKLKTVVQEQSLTLTVNTLSLFLPMPPWCFRILVISHKNLKSRN